MRRPVPCALAAVAWLSLPAVTRAEEVIEYIVRRGETLWSIAARNEIYGDARLWPLIYRYNRDQIVDPARIFPKQRLRIPLDVDEDARREALYEAARGEAE